MNKVRPRACLKFKKETSLETLLGFASHILRYTVYGVSCSLYAHVHPDLDLPR